MNLFSFSAWAPALVTFTGAWLLAQEVSETPEASATPEAQPANEGEGQQVRPTAQQSEKTLFAWERWVALSLNDKQLEGQLEPIQIRLDSDEQALYVRFELPASLPIAEFEEGQPAWRAVLILVDPLAEREPQEEPWTLALVDSAAQDRQRENGVRVLKYREADGALRIELNIPRAVAEAEVPWGADGPAIPFYLSAQVELLNYGSNTDASVLIEEEAEAPEAGAGQGPEEAEAAQPEAQQPLIFEFSTGKDEQGVLQSWLVPVP